MCGRYSFAPQKKQTDADLKDKKLPADWKISFNIAPTHRALVLASDQKDCLQPMTWGLIPQWSRDGQNGGKNINARAEGILDKPSFQDPALHRHCIVPADSFYEWRTAPGRRKIPYRIFLNNGHLLWMAGIWDEWFTPKGDIIRSFSIITITPNKEMSELHTRMPVMLLTEAEREAWLTVPNEPETVLAQLHPPPDGILDRYRVSEKLNTPGVDNPALHERHEEELTLF
jgi:putative SOS response-associated peptidase YedK